MGSNMAKQNYYLRWCEKIPDCLARHYKAKLGMMGTREEFVGHNLERAIELAREVAKETGQITKVVTLIGIKSWQLYFAVKPSGEESRRPPFEEWALG